VRRWVELIVFGSLGILALASVYVLYRAAH
jgi:hypothetical protein